MSFPAEIEQRMRREREGETEEGRFLSLRTSFADALSRKSGEEGRISVGLIRENLSRLRLSASV